MYFQDYFSDIKRIFTSFMPNVVSQINKFYTNITSMHTNCSTSVISDNGKTHSSATGNNRPKLQNQTTFVGIHVRRGDMKVPNLVDYGFSSGEEDFIGRAMLHFIKRFSHVTFIVCSDDVAWCRQNIVLPELFRNLFAVHFCNDNDSPMVHLGILAACNHSILTGGTFGWWSAFLAGGEAVYFTGYPRSGSRFAKGFTQSRSDYYIPGWIGL